MDGFIQLAMAAIGEGSMAIKAMLLLICAAEGWLYWNLLKQSREERKELIELFQKQIEQDHKELIDIIEQYNEGNVKTIEAINDIKVLIATIGGKL